MYIHCHGLSSYKGLVKESCRGHVKHQNLHYISKAIQAKSLTFSLFIQQVKSHTNAHGKDASGVSHAVMNWLVITENIRAQSLLSVVIAIVVSHAVITLHFTWNDTFKSQLCFNSSKSSDKSQSSTYGINVENDVEFTLLFISFKSIGLVFYTAIIW